MNPADEAWVKMLYKNNALKMYKIALRRLNDAEEAQNIVQEAFLALIEKVDFVKNHPNPPGWLMKAMHFLILQYIEECSKRDEHEVSMDEHLTQIVAPQAPLVSLRDMLPLELSQRERDLLVWFYEEKASYKEISARLKIPIMTCRTQMFRAKQHYKRLAEKQKDFSELM